MLMYDKDDMSEVSGPQTCKFFMSSLAEYLKTNQWPFGTFDLKTNNVNASTKEILAKELGLKYSGKWKSTWQTWRRYSAFLLSCFLPKPLYFVSFNSSAFPFLHMHNSLYQLSAICFFPLRLHSLDFFLAKKMLLAGSIVWTLQLFNTLSVKTLFVCTKPFGMLCSTSQSFPINKKMYTVTGKYNASKLVPYKLSFQKFIQDGHPKLYC